MNISPEMKTWFLGSDPAIQWQVMRDLLHEPSECFEPVRQLVSERGWGAQILLHQDADGLWNRRLYDGKWISTTYSLYTLKLLGLPSGHPQAQWGCEQLLTRGLYQGREIRFSRSQALTDPGVTAIVCSILCYFGYGGETIHPIIEFLTGLQQAEGYWYPDPSPVQSKYIFEVTLLVLEALLQYRRRYTGYPQQSSVLKAVQRGQEFLLKNNLGIGIKKNWTTFSFPPYWFYDILTALEYFWSFHDNKDPRLETAMQLLRRKQAADGTWRAAAHHPGETYFEMEKPGQPSRWNTLRALRVLSWWESQPDSPRASPLE